MASTTTSAPAKVPALITTPLVIVAAVFPVLSLVAIITRDKARRIARQPFQTDDYWIVLSWVRKVCSQNRALANCGEDSFTVLEHQCLDFWGNRGIGLLQDKSISRNQGFPNGKFTTRKRRRKSTG